MEQFVEVLLPLNLPKCLTYKIPEEWHNYVFLYQRIIVRVRQKLYTGIILKIHNEVPLGYQAQEIENLLDQTPIINDKQLQLWQWISNYYLCNLGEVYNAALPATLLLSGEQFIGLVPNCECINLNPKEQLIIDLLATKSEIAEIGRAHV